MNLQRILNFLGSNIVPVLFVTITVIGWIAKQIKEQKQRTNAAREQQRRQLEGLRTGRIEEASTTLPSPTPARASTPPPSAKASLEEIAARRRAKMDEMQRRRAHAPAQGSAQGSVQSPQSRSDAAQQEIGRVLGQILGVPTSAPRAPHSTPPAAPRSSPVPANQRPQKRPFEAPRTQPRPGGQPQAQQKTSQRNQQRTQQQYQAQQRPQTPVRPTPVARDTREGESSTRSTTTGRGLDTSARKMRQSSQPTFAPVHNQDAPVYNYNLPNNKAIKVNKMGRSTSPSRGARHTMFDGQFLRQVFIMREIFEKPVALRD